MPILNQGNVTSMIVPDTYVIIVPPSTLNLNNVAANIVGMVGLASWGPINTPVQIGSMADYASTFGQIFNRKYDMGTAAAIIAQQGSASFYCARATDGSDVKASAAIGTSVTFTAKYSGILGNSVRVTVGNGSKASTFRFTIGVPGYISETFDNIGTTHPVVNATTTAATTTSTTLTVPTTNIAVGDVITGTGISGGPVTVASITDTTHLVMSSSQSISSGTAMTFTPSQNELWVNLATAINNGQNGRLPSRWVTAVAGVGTSSPSVGTTYTLAGGADGDASVTAATLVGTTSPVAGMYALSGTGFSILDVVDVDDATQWTAIDAFANAESGYAVQQVAAATSVAGAVTAKQTAGLDSYNSKLMHGDWLFWSDPVNKITRLVAPQHFVAGRLGNLSPALTTLNKPLHGIAGSQKVGIVGSANVISTFTRSDIETLDLAGIDVVMNPGAGGLNIWTCRIGHNTSSSLDIHLDNYPLLTNYIAKTLNAGLGLYLGRSIDRQLFHDIYTTLTYFLQVITGQGMLSSPDGTQPFSVQCDIINNPPSVTNQGMVVANVQAKYNSINERFVVNLQGGNTITVTHSSDVQ